MDVGVDGFNREEGRKKRMCYGARGWLGGVVLLLMIMLVCRCGWKGRGKRKDERGSNE